MQQGCDAGGATYNKIHFERKIRLCTACPKQNRLPVIEVRTALAS
jgi:hypothetical protein